MDFIVTPAVLIPRPETEHVIETVLEITRTRLTTVPGVSDIVPQGLKPEFAFAANGTAGRRALPKTVDESSAGVERTGGQACPPHASPRIVDVGTGSGCIALALAKELPVAEIHATDISSAALEIAQANAARHQLESRIQFHHADLLQGLSLAGLDFVVSNPPYVGESEQDQVQLEVRKFEPHNAVFAGPTGVEVIARLIPQARASLKPGGWLVLEISGAIADETKHLLRDWDDVRVIPDLQSIPRVALARRPRG